MKKNITKLISISLLVIGPLLLFSGCETDPNSTPVPWSQPADWEGQVPGLGR